ncbi:MAG TPA: BatA and WFA domain-containing protein [Planctomycetota bacterium]|nr:BatA and WFA domain-containing protein [Planctomycetota bacterium]
MTFLFPAMLAGLLGLGVPIALHLIARHRFPVRDFPSIRLLQKDVRTNVFAPRLIDVPQLILRLIVLSLLVLAMSRLFSPQLSTDGAPRNLVLILDCSAGMQMQIQDETTRQKVSLFEKAQGQGRQLIEKLAVPSHAAVILAAEKPVVSVPLDTNFNSALAALENSKPIDGTGCGIIPAIAAGCELVAVRREIASQIVILTDMRANGFGARDQKSLQRIEQIRKERGEALQLFVLDISAGTELENTAITDAYVRGRNTRVGDDAHVVTRVLNSSSGQKNVRLNMKIGDRKEPAYKEIPLEPGAEAVVDMTARVQRAANTIASVQIAEDGMVSDDEFSVPLNISDARRILIINGSTQTAADTKQPLAGQLGDSPVAGSDEPQIDGATILRFVLNPGRELGAAYGTGIDVTMITPEAVAAQTLSKYDLIALYDVSGLPETALDDLNTFVREGRSALIVCAGQCQALQFNRTLAAGSAQRPALAPAVIGNDRALEQPVDIAQKSTAHPMLALFNDRLRGDLSVIRFAKLREIQSIADGASVIMTAASGQPLAVEQTLGRGKIILLTFGFELERGNLARARAFPPLVWRMVDYLTGQLRQRPPDIVKAMSPAVLDVSEPAFSFASELELVPEKESAEGKGTKTAGADKTQAIRIASKGDQTATIPALPAGRFLLTKAGPVGETVRTGYARYVTSHIDPLESDTRRMEQSNLTALLGPGLRVIGAKDAGNLAISGGEFWRILIAALAAAYLCESILGYVQSVRRERQRAGEMTA